MAKARNYKKEYAQYHGTEKAKKERAMRNAARRDAIDEGRVKKHDGKEIDHVKPISKGGTNSKGNTRVVSRETNRKKYNKTTTKKKSS